MKFANPKYENEELTYEDVFLFQNYFDGKSRLDVSVKPVVDLGTNIPIVSANMNAVSGRRMAETLARYGGLSVLPQDMDIETLEKIIYSVKNANIKYDTPIVVKSDHTIRDAMGIIYKRSHDCVVLIDDENKAIGIFKSKDFENLDQFTMIGNIKKSNLITGKVGISDQEAFDLMEEKSISSLPIVDENGVLKGILTQKHAIRNSIYSPSIDHNNKLNLAVAIGVNGFDDKVKKLYDLGINIFVLDTAHGYQKSMIDSIKKFREFFGDKPILIAGNVITASATRDLIQAGANGVKVGIGPGAMCTTRMKTGVGRPQFSAVWECSKQAKELGGFVWADGGIKNPRDMHLALAAGANHVMIGTTFAGTFESVGDVKYDEDGLMYKENYGMASRKAVIYRNQSQSRFEIARKQMFREGISTSRIYLKSSMESVGDVVDEFIAGLRSSMAYVGANNLEEFYNNSIVGVQTNAGYNEGTPHGRVRK